MVCVLKFNNGEIVVGKMVEEDNKYLYIDTPTQFNYQMIDDNSMGIVGYPWLQYSNDTLIPIPKDQLMVISNNPTDFVVEYYNQYINQTTDSMELDNLESIDSPSKYLN